MYDLHLGVINFDSLRCHNISNKRDSIWNVLFFNLFFHLFWKIYTIISKFSKTNLLPSWPMAVGANRHGPWQLQVLKCPTDVAHGG
jgi:hypothetical protein